MIRGSSVAETEIAYLTYIFDGGEKITFEKRLK